MRKICITILFFLTISMAHGQTMFNKIIEDTVAHITSSVIALDTGYVFLSGTGNEYNVRSFALTYLNENGNKQWKHIYGDAQNEFWEGWFGNYKKLNDISYISGSYVNPVTGEKGIHITKYDNSFNLISQDIIFYDSIDKRAYYTNLLSDNCYYITGAVDFEDIEQLKLLLLKADSSGNYIWHKNYSGEYAYGSKIIETSEHNVLVSGARSYPIGVDNTKWYLLKTDTAGNVIWEQEYGRNNYNNGKVSGLIETRDSNYLACGVYPAASYGSETLYDGCLRKIDTTGELIWEKHYRNYSCHPTGDNITISGSFSSIHQLPNGDFILIGSSHWYYTILRGYLMLLDSKGNIKWHHYYFAEDYTSSWQYFVDFKPTKDGGYILAGYGNDYSDFGYSPPQQAWLVKTDSLGMDGLSNTEPDALQVDVEIPDTVCRADTIPLQVHIAGKSAPYTLSFSTGQVIDSIYYPPTFVPQEVGLGLVALEWGGSYYHTENITEATITNHAWGECIVKDVDFHTPAGIGAHEVSITLTDAYGETTTITKHITTKSCGNAISQETNQTNCRLFPNPATNKLHLEIPGITQTQYAEIYDASGKLVFTQSISTKTTTLDISNLHSGNYILKIDGISKGFTVVR